MQPEKNRYKNVLWIGGSPCAGKSSIARLLAERHKLTVHHCDDVSDIRVKKMRSQSLPVTSELHALGTCGRLAKPPKWQAEKEVAFYIEQFSFVLSELANIQTGSGIVAEGADLMPELLGQLGVPPERAVWVIPTPEFQLQYYQARDWVADYLKDCDNPKKAFDNWMQRDILFANYIKRTAEEYGGKVIVVDGKSTIEQNTALVERHFGLKT